MEACETGIVLVSSVLATLMFLSTAACAGEQAQNPLTIFQEAQRALDAGQFAQAEQGFSQVLKIDPNSAAARANLGVVYLRTNQLDAAIKTLKEAKKLAPKVVGIDLDLGLAYYRKRDFSNAIPEFDPVLQFTAGHFQARYLLGMSYFMNDDYEHAVQTLQPLQDLEKADLDFLFVMGICYGKLKREADSARAFEQLLSAGGETAHMHLLLGKAYLDLYQDQAAQKELEEAEALAGRRLQLPARFGRRPSPTRSPLPQ